MFYWICGPGAHRFDISIGKQSLLERLLGKALPEGGLSLPASTWRNYSLLMGAFYLALRRGQYLGGDAIEPRPTG